MSADDCSGRSYVSGSCDSSMEREFSGGLGGPTVSTPNSQHSSPNRSLSANSIKVELYSDEEPGCTRRREKRGVEGDEGWKNEQGGEECLELGAGSVRGGEGGYSDAASPDPTSPGPIRLPNGKLKCDVCGMICIGPNVLMVHKRSHTGERPFQCNQCGASFTQKGNLLRHIKLHSGEKPFKCPFCSYACRRRDALTGHLRTHSVCSSAAGKPYKCSYCGRSYKQQNTLEEHWERCHGYLQSLEPQAAQATLLHGEELRDAEFGPDSLFQPSTDKLTFIERLANSITKRKRSMPQKFVGEKHRRLNLADTPTEYGASLDNEGEMLCSQLGTNDTSNFVGVGGGYFEGPGGFGGPEQIRSLRLPPHHPTCSPDFTPVISSVYTHGLGSRMECAVGGAGAGGVAIGLGGREAGEGHEDLPASCSHAPSPSDGCQDSTDSESMPEDQPTVAGAAATSDSNPYHHPPPPQQQQQRGLSHAKERDVENPKQVGGVQSPAPPAGSGEVVQVVDGEGRPVRSFRCEHCRVLFLDHVMFTIHMGCHGFRQPFQCNICGHRSQDRYEFSSHIIRGEHEVG